MLNGRGQAVRRGRRWAEGERETNSQEGNTRKFRPLIALATLRRYEGNKGRMGGKLVGRRESSLLSDILHIDIIFLAKKKYRGMFETQKVLNHF